MGQLRRRWYLVVLGAVAAPVVGASLAYACTSLATLSLNPNSGTEGQTVTVTGRGFAQHDPADARTGQPVEIRFDSVRTPLLATAAPGADGTFTAQIRVPQAPTGDHVIVATQNRADGRPASGTPARQSFTVVAAPKAVANNSPSAPTQATGQPAAPAAPAQIGALPAGAGTAAPAAIEQGGSAGATQTANNQGAAFNAQGTPASPSGSAGVVSNPATAPVPFGASASAPAVGPRSMMTPDTGGSTVLAGLLVAAGLILSLGGAAMVVAGRRNARTEALARR